MRVRVVEDVNERRKLRPGPVRVASYAPVELLSADASRSGSAEPPELRASEPFEVFYRRELPRLVALAGALCGSRSADDLAQEAMLAAYRRWDAIGSYDSPEAWVRRVCTNRATSLLRTRGAEARAVLRLAARPPEVPPLSQDHQAFWVEVRRLPRRQLLAGRLDRERGDQT